MHKRGATIFELSFSFPAYVAFSHSAHSFIVYFFFCWVCQDGHLSVLQVLSFVCLDWVYYSFSFSISPFSTGCYCVMSMNMNYGNCRATTTRTTTSEQEPEYSKYSQSHLAQFFVGHFLSFAREF